MHATAGRGAGHGQHRVVVGVERQSGRGRWSNRKFFFITLLFNEILTYDVVVAFRDHQGNWGHMGLGSLVLLINAAPLWMYNMFRHSCRHIMAGRINHFSKRPVRYWIWSRLTPLNARHAQIAWASLVWVAVTDLYVRLVASGTIIDPSSSEKT